MPVPQNLQDTLSKIDVDTDQLATVVKSLRDKISTSMSQEDVNLVQTRLDQVAARLEGIASDPNQPIPPGAAPRPV